MTQFTEAPIFDADQHMYETPDALTQVPARAVLRGPCNSRSSAATPGS